MSIEERLTVCNMSIEAGARAGMVAPDETTFAYLKGRPFAPKGAQWDKALAYWRTLPSDADAVFDKEIYARRQHAGANGDLGQQSRRRSAGRRPRPGSAAEPDPERRAYMLRTLEYMGLAPGMALTDIQVDQVFIGSCTNARIEDLRAASRIVKGGRAVIPALVVPGSTQVKLAAEAEGLDRIFRDAGFTWGESGCSMCVAMNGDWLARESAALRHRTAISSVAKAKEAARILSVRQWPRPLRSPAASPMCASSGAEWSHLSFSRTWPLPSISPTLTPIRSCRRDFCAGRVRTAIEDFLFRDLRFREDGSENPDFVLNQRRFARRASWWRPQFRRRLEPRASALGSDDYGIRCVIAADFGDIFYSNSLKSGLLPVQLDVGVCMKLREQLHARPGATLRVDLPRQAVTGPDGATYSFTIDPFRKRCLLEGLDDIGVTLQHDAAITAFEQSYRQKFDWLFGPGCP